MDLGGSKKVIFHERCRWFGSRVLLREYIWRTHGEMISNVIGQVIAAIDHEMFKIRHEYHATILQGIDTVVILAICVVLDDKARRGSFARTQAIAGAIAG